MGSAVDITDCKCAQEEAFARQKLESLTVLTRAIAHDFGSLLGSILAEAELAETDLAEGLSPGEAIQHIKAIANRASEIVRELMTYSGQEECYFETVDLAGLVEEMLELLKASISKHATLHVDISKHLPPVSCNATQIRKVVMNLVINASQAIGDNDGVITVRLSPAPEGQDSEGAGAQNDFVRLEISDTGCGMTEAEKAKIFDPFFTTKPGGYGLGLAVVHGIVHSHGGAINIVSSRERGTTLEVLLPVTTGAPR
jgi:signal transduction histidine kinase